MHISGYSAENVSKPPAKKKKGRKRTGSDHRTAQGHIHVKIWVSRKVTTAHWGYFGTLFTPAPAGVVTAVIRICCPVVRIQ